MGTSSVWATTLQQWWAAQALLRERGTPTAETSSGRARLLEEARASSAMQVIGPVEDQRLRDMVDLSVDYLAWRELAIDEPDIDRLITSKRLDWSWYWYDLILFKTESAVREAALCIRHDGEEIADVVARAGATIESRRTLLQDLGPDERAALVSLVPDGLGGPFVIDGRLVLVRLRAVSPPDRDNAETRQSARQELADDALRRFRVRKGTASRGVVTKGMGNEDVLAEIPFIGMLPETIRPLVIELLEPRSYEFGDVIIEQGGPPDGLYLMVNGSARVVMAADGGIEATLGHVGPGDTFGEAALLDGAPRSATVRASSHVEVLVLDARVFGALRRLHPELGVALESHRRVHTLQRFLRTQSAFASIPLEGLIEMGQELTEVHFAPGERVIEEGGPADCLVHREGRPPQGLEVRRRSLDRRRLPAHGRCLWRGGAPAGAAAAGDC